MARRAVLGFALLAACPADGSQVGQTVIVAAMNVVDVPDVRMLADVAAVAVGVADRLADSWPVWR